MNGKSSIYFDVDGNEWDLKSLDAKERRFLSDLQKFADKCHRGSGSPMQRWCEFDNHFLPRLLALSEAKGLTRKEVTRSIVFNIAQDLSSRLGIALGLMRQPNYRDYLQRIVTDQFKSRRAFCEATGLSEDMLSHVLAGRKDLSIGTLTKALDRIGYTIQFVPRDPTKTRSA